MPICSRCRTLQKTCVYTDLRRSRRRRAGVEKPKHSEYLNGFIEEAGDISRDSQRDWLSDVSPHRSSAQPLLVSAIDALQSRALMDSGFLASRSVDGFYNFFFPGHPFVLPRMHLIRQSERNPEFSCELVLMITFIGSLYIHDSLANEYRQSAEKALEGQLAPNGFNVQALMLFAVALEWRGENERAAAILERAKTMGLEIGIQRRDFALRYGNGDAVLEESWRRTWWELYVLDALFAGIRHLPTFTLWGMDTDVDLPCEEQLYVTGVRGIV